MCIRDRVRRGIDLRASQERQARPGFRLHPSGRMDIGRRNQAQPHRLRRHIRQRTVHRKENRWQKAGERQDFQEEGCVTLPNLSSQKTATAVFSFAHRLRSSPLYILAVTGCKSQSPVISHCSSGGRSSVFCGEFGGGRANIKAHSVLKALPNSPYGHHPLNAARKQEWPIRKPG